VIQQEIGGKERLSLRCGSPIAGRNLFERVGDLDVGGREGDQQICLYPGVPYGNTDKKFSLRKGKKRKRLGAIGQVDLNSRKEKKNFQRRGGTLRGEGSTPSFGGEAYTLKSFREEKGLKFNWGNYLEIGLQSVEKRLSHQRRRVIRRGGGGRKKLDEPLEGDSKKKDHSIQGSRIKDTEASGLTCTKNPRRVRKICGETFT